MKLLKEFICLQVEDLPFKGAKIFWNLQYNALKILLQHEFDLICIDSWRSVDPNILN